MRQPSSLEIDAELAQLGAGFESCTAQVRGATLHYIRGGDGPAVVLVHGFPQDWYAFRKVMPALARRFTVIAVDLPGIGGSTGTEGEYDAASLAAQIHALASHLQLRRLYLAGHDIGGMLTYVYARMFPDSLRGAMILDVPVPGLGPQDEIVRDVAVWHVQFHQVPGLAERLIAGRQADYFRYFLGEDLFGEDDLAHYAQAYANPCQLHAIFEMYRAFPRDATCNAMQTSQVDVPLVLVAGCRSPFLKYLPWIAEDMRAHGIQTVTTEAIEDSSHYVAEEAPEQVIALIERYAALLEPN